MISLNVKANMNNIKYIYTYKKQAADTANYNFFCIVHPPDIVGLKGDGDVNLCYEKGDRQSGWAKKASPNDIGIYL